MLINNFLRIEDTKNLVNLLQVNKKVSSFQIEGDIAINLVEYLKINKTLTYLTLYADYLRKDSCLYEYNDVAIEKRLNFMKELINLIVFNNTLLQLDLKQIFSELSFDEQNDLLNALYKNHQLETTALTDDLTLKQQKIFDMRFNKGNFFIFPSVIEKNKNGEVLKEEINSKIRFEYNYFN
jgi:hypothetical protein